MSLNDILVDRSPHSFQNIVGFQTREVKIYTQGKTDDITPLREPTFFILLSLVSGPRHGYAIMKDVLDLSAGRVKLSTSTLYSALKRLLERGWIRRIENPIANQTNRKRKSYILSDAGRKILGFEIERLEGIVLTARERSLEESVEIF